MRSPSRPATAGKERLAPRTLTALAMLGALLFALKLAMASLPNIHPVAVLIIAGTLCFQWRMLYAVGVYVLLEGLVFGFGLWWISYLYCWPLLVALTMLLRNNQGRWFWAAVAAAFGLCFGALCALPYFFLGGPGMAFSYWISGIPFDLLHGGGNFALTAVLLTPLQRVLRRFCGA